MTKPGPVPFGYYKVGKNLVRHEVDAEIRNLVFSLFLSSKKKSVVASELSAMGYRTRSGTLFSSQTVGRYLSDPVVLGRAPNVEQIVSDELFRQVQDILQAQAQAGGAKRAPRHLLAGLLYCGCGQKMYVPSGSRKYVCTTCRNKAVVEDLEKLVVDQLRELPGAKVSPLNKLFIQWEALPFSARREVVEALVDKIELDDMDVTLSLKDV
ncbi:MAG: recombinase family protein [Pseudomonadota bacterium]